MKVRVLPSQPHCFAFGGFEVQMLSTLAAVQRAGVDAERLDIWSRDANFDILHVWGLELSQGPAMRWARRSQKIVVMSALLPYRTIAHTVYYLASSLCGQVKMRRALIREVDAFVVLNDLQAESAKRLLGVPQDLIRVIPNVVESDFFQAASTASPRDRNGAKDYVLCAGNVSRRKNQLNLTRAALAVGCPLLIVGDVLAGEEAYGESLSDMISGQASVTWLPGLSPGSPELVSLFRGCRGFALPSFSEQQPLSALEAAVVGKPLLLGDRAYARQRYYTNARLVDPASIASIGDGLRDILGSPGAHVPPAEFLDECRGERVGKAYSSLFNELVSSRDQEKRLRPGRERN